MVWIAGLFALSIVVFVVEGAWRGGRKREPTRIADCVAEGDEVVIVGTVVAIEPLLAAPVSGRACVGYLLVGGLGDRRRIHHRLTRFAVDDGSARAIVVPSEPTELALELGRSSLRRRTTGAAGLDELGMTEADRLHEGRLEPGATVAVYGAIQLLAVAGTSETSGYRDGSLRQVQIVRPRHGQLVVSDRADRASDVQSRSLSP